MKGHKSNFYLFWIKAVYELFIGKCIYWFWQDLSPVHLWQVLIQTRFFFSIRLMTKVLLPIHYSTVDKILWYVLYFTVYIEKIIREINESGIEEEEGAGRFQCLTAEVLVTLLYRPIFIGNVSYVQYPQNHELTFRNGGGNRSVFPFLIRISSKSIRI